jgi:hypothetical protein
MSISNELLSGILKKLIIAQHPELGYMMRMEGKKHSSGGNFTRLAFCGLETSHYKWIGKQLCWCWEIVPKNFMWTSNKIRSCQRICPCMMPCLAFCNTYLVKHKDKFTLPGFSQWEIVSFLPNGQAG